MLRAGCGDGHSLSFINSVATFMEDLPYRGLRFVAAVDEVCLLVLPVPVSDQGLNPGKEDCPCLCRGTNFSFGGLTRLAAPL